MAKKRKSALPRVTLLAYNRRDLVAFVSAVEALRHIVDDLRLIADDMKRKRPARPPASPSPTGEGEP